MNLELINGNTHIDSRGMIRFINDFDMTKVVRMYSITPELGVIRAWQGHLLETKWLFAAKGSFTVKTVPLNNTDLVTEWNMSEMSSQVLQIPGGHYNGFKSNQKGSILMVFSDTGLETSKTDDIRQTLELLPWIK
jgi:dTDP-4-dehydrorhamnose 3,5-epimerase